MSLAWLPCVVLFLGAAQEDKLEIVNHHRTYGYLGAPRPKETGSLPGEHAHFTFEIKNLKQDAEGRAFFSIAIEIRDEAGKIIYEQRPHNSVARNFLGGNTLPCSAHVAVPLDAKPGIVDWKITVVDRTTKKSVSSAGKGKILPAAFGIVQVGLFADAEARVPHSPVAVVGDSVYLQLSAVGFARTKDGKQPDVEVSMRILDDKGQPTMAQPLVGKINAGVNPEDKLLPVQFGLSLNRAGRFTVEVTSACRVSGSRSQISYALRVLPME